MSLTLRRSIHAAAACALALVPVLGCAGGTAGTGLEPAPSAVTAPAGAAVQDVGGIRMLVGHETWPGKVEISGSVTPLSITIDNHGARSLMIRYEDFSLTGPEDQRFAAIPPFQVKGSVEEPAVAEVYSPLTAPEFTYRDFMVAPYFSKLYPGIHAYTEPFSWPYDYYRTFETFWTKVDLPTPTMLQRALPEGVLAPGGLLGGWLYFQKVETGILDITFRADLVDAKTGKAFGSIAIPFEMR